MISNQDSEKMLTPWLTVIGLITVMWTPVERKIDECVFILRLLNGCGKRPGSLTRKLDYIKSSLPETAIYSPNFDEIIDITKGTAQVRDVCVHGVIESYDENKMVIGKVQAKACDFNVEYFTYDQVRLFSAGNNLTTLLEIWSKLASDLNNIANDA